MENKETYKKAGWLTKKGGTRGEKHGDKRWFVLKAKDLFYYVKEKDYPHQPKGGIDLHEAILIEQSFTKCEYGFQIVEVSGDEGRTYYLEPANQKDKEEWCEVIRKELPAKPRGGAGTYVYRNIHCGYLIKRSSKDKGRWQKRFFVLQPDAMAYYNHPSDHLPPDKPKGLLFLQGGTVTLENVEKHPYAFQITCKEDGKEKRTYYLEPEPASQAFRDEWIQAINIVLTNPEEAKLLSQAPVRQTRISMGLSPPNSRPGSPISPTISPKGRVWSPGTSPVTSAPSSPRAGGSQYKDESHSASPKVSSTPPSQNRDLPSTPSPPPSESHSGPPGLPRALSSPSPPPATRSIPADTPPASSSMIVLSTQPDPQPPSGAPPSLFQSLLSGIRPSTTKTLRGTVASLGGRPAPITTTSFPVGTESIPTSPVPPADGSEPSSPHTPTSRTSSRASSTTHSRTSSTSRSRPPSVSRETIPVIHEEASSAENSRTPSPNPTPPPNFQIGPDFSSSFIISSSKKGGGDLPMVPETDAVVVEVLPRASTPLGQRPGTPLGQRSTTPDPSGFGAGSIPRSGSFDSSSKTGGEVPPSPTADNSDLPRHSHHTKSGSLAISSGPASPSKHAAPPSPARKIIFPPIPITPRKTGVGSAPPNPLGPPPPPPPLSQAAINTLSFVPHPAVSSGLADIPEASSPSLGLSVVVPIHDLKVVPPGPPPTPESRAGDHNPFPHSPPGPPPTPPSQLGASYSETAFPPPSGETPSGPTPPSDPFPTSSPSKHPIPLAPKDVLPPSGAPPPSTPGSYGAVPVLLTSLPTPPPPLDVLSPPTTTATPTRPHSPFRAPAKLAILHDEVVSSPSSSSSAQPPSGPPPG